LAHGGIRTRVTTVKGPLAAVIAWHHEHGWRDTTLIQAVLAA
jgi:hypothetical protein